MREETLMDFFAGDNYAITDLMHQDLIHLEFRFLPTIPSWIIGKIIIGKKSVISGQN